MPPPAITSILLVACLLLSVAPEFAGEFRVVYSSNGSAVFTSPGGSTSKPYKATNIVGWGEGGYVHHNGAVAAA